MGNLRVQAVSHQGTSALADPGRSSERLQPPVFRRAADDGRRKFALWPVATPRPQRAAQSGGGDEDYLLGSWAPNLAADGFFHQNLRSHAVPEPGLLHRGNDPLHYRAAIRGFRAYRRGWGIQRSNARYSSEVSPPALGFR